MIWKFCLANKENPISENVYGCTSVVPFSSLHNGEFYRSIDDTDFQDVSPDMFPIPENWVFEFNGEEFSVRLKTETENIEKYKQEKMLELYSHLDKLEVEPFVLSDGTRADCNAKSKISLADADTMYHKSWYSGPIVFVDYDNINNIIDLARWDSIFMEISVEFGRRYMFKQNTRTAIEKAKTIEELNNIKF